MSGSARRTIPFIDAIGGSAGAHALAHAFYRRVLLDPVLIPLFRDPSEPHAERMGWWLEELFGGAPIHTRERGGFPVMVSSHFGLRISEEQRLAWLAHMASAAGEVGLTAPVRIQLMSYVESASRLAASGSH